MRKALVCRVILVILMSLGAGCTPAAAPSYLSPPAPAVAAAATSNPNLLPLRGLYVQFERRGHQEEYWSGQVLQLFDTTDEILGHTVREEVALQLDEMAKLGVNTIAYELRSSSPDSAGNNFVAPKCTLPPVLGLQYPQPTVLELKNLVEFLDLLHSKGMKIQLRLVNTHMEEQPPTGNTTWLGSILNAVKGHPALDLILFEGSPFMIDSTGDGVPDRCGDPVEAPLWDGPGSIPADYIQWAIGYGHSLGIPYVNLSAEAIVGDYYAFMQGPGGAEMTDQHQWDPVYTIKTIFDNLNISDDQRTYALSWYEHPKCMTARQLPCRETGPHAWAIETAQHVREVVGQDSQARIVVPEMGLAASMPEWNWTTEQALESLVWVMKTYGMDGGSFWRWTDFLDNEEHDPRLAIPIKKRGTDFVYNPVAETLRQLYTQGYVTESSLQPAVAATAFALTQAAPPPPPNDSFDGTELDALKWLPDVSPGAALAQQDGRLVLSTDGSQPTAGSSVAGNWVLTGDFDIQVEWRLGDDWTSPAADHDDAAFMAVGMGHPQRYWITRIGLPRDQGQFMAYGEAAGQIGQPAGTSARAGLFRLTRTGDTLVFFYDVGNGWQQLQTVAVPTGPAQIRIGMDSVNSSHAFSTLFDNFRINAGQAEYGP